MRSLSNLLKSFYVKEDESDSRVIDSNEIIAERLRVLEEQMREREFPEDAEFAEGFVEGLDADQVEELMADRDQNGDTQADIYARVEEAKAELERLNEQASVVIEDAKSQADAVLAEAKEEAARIREDARSEGHEEGFQAGHAEGMAKVQEAEDALQRRAEELEQSYEKMFSDLEPQMMDLLCDIYRDVLSVDLTGRSDVVVYLLQKAMQNIEGGTNYLVHVSPEDHPYAVEHKDVLVSLAGPAGTLELVEDHTLKQGQSYIETESGIFDCSFGVEMELLSKEIKLLSRSESGS